MAGRNPSKIDRKWGHMALHRFEAAEMEKSWLILGGLCFETHIFVAKTANLGSLVAKNGPRGGIRELEPPKCGPRGGDPDEAALPHPGGLETDPEGCPRSPPLGLLSCLHDTIRIELHVPTIHHAEQNMHMSTYAGWVGSEL